jgi:hypothetical protein
VSPVPLVVGVDFDNTLVSYDDLILSVALERGLIQDGTRKSKKDIRDAIRRLDGGEIEWQRVQGVVYGPRMNEAKASDGAKAFLTRCADANVSVYVVSHKTSFANYDETGTDLRAAALSWVERQGWFGDSGPRLPRNRVYFESSRKEKVERIEQLGCSHFIDDLEETFLEEGFPEGVQKILYAPYPTDAIIPGVATVSSWDEAAELTFGLLAR